MSKKIRTLVCASLIATATTAQASGLPPSYYNRMAWLLGFIGMGAVMSCQRRDDCAV